MIVIDMDIIKSAEEIGGKIGNPTPINADGMILLKYIGLTLVKPRASTDFL